MTDDSKRMKQKFNFNQPTDLAMDIQETYNRLINERRQIAKALYHDAQYALERDEPREYARLMDAWLECKAETAKLCSQQHNLFA